MKNYSYLYINKQTKGRDFLKSTKKMATLQNTQTEELANEVANLQEEITILNNRLKSDYTGWNIVEAIENLSFELKRMNDREEQKGK